MYLEELPTQKLKERILTTEGRISDDQVAWIALLLAVLGSGAQFSVTQGFKGTALAQEFGKPKSSEP